MTNYTYTINRPIGSQSPAAQRQTLETNTNSNAAIWTEDHHGFGDNVGGTHKFMRLPAFTAPAVVSDTGTQGSVLFPAAGVADVNTAQAYFKNTNLTFPVSALRAFAVFDGSAIGAIVPQNGYNIASINQGSTGQYVITLTTNAVASNRFAVMSNADNSGGIILNSNYNITGTGTFTLSTYSYSPFTLRSSNSVSFLVLQI